jgi:nucleotide-binding universal stress UspA family protein
MTGRVVAGVDGSVESSRALGWAVAEAAARGAVLQPVIVWQSPYDYGELRYVPVDEDQLVKGQGNAWNRCSPG